MPKKCVAENKKETFGLRLANLRKNRGLTQTELGKLIGVSQRVVSYYEIETERPPADILIPLANALKVSIDELLGYQPPKNEPMIKNKKLLRRLKDFDQLSDQDQKVILHYIDTILGKR